MDIFQSNAQACDQLIQLLRNPLPVTSIPGIYNRDLTVLNRQSIHPVLDFVLCQQVGQLLALDADADRAVTAGIGHKIAANLHGFRLLPVSKSETNPSLFYLTSNFIPRFYFLQVRRFAEAAPAAVRIYAAIVFSGNYCNKKSRKTEVFRDDLRYF